MAALLPQCRYRDREAVFSDEVSSCQMTVCLPPELVSFSVMSCGMSSFLPPPLSNSTTAQRRCLLLSFCVFSPLPLEITGSAAVASLFYRLKKLLVRACLCPIV